MKIAFLDKLVAIDWIEFFAPTNDDFDLMTAVFTCVMSSLLEVHAQLKCREVAGTPALWITSELKSLMKGRHMAKKENRERSLLLVSLSETAEESQS